MRLETKQARMIVELLTDAELSNLISDILQSDTEATMDRVKGLMRLAYLKGRQDLTNETADILGELVKNSEEVI